MIDEKSAKLSDDGVSPYLQQPLRTLEKAQRDRKRRHLEAVNASAKTKQPD
jgi:hypothetical protein